MITPRLCTRVATVWITISLVSCDSDSGDASSGGDEHTSASSLEKIAKLEGDVTFTLEDGEARHREHPDTFWVPTRKDRENLVKDDLVKLVFNLTDGKQTQAERMWVLITSGDSAGYTGKLDNDPYCMDKIKAGLEVAFEPRHVIEIYEPETPEPEDHESAPRD